MAKTVPMIVSNKAIFVYDRQTNQFRTFKMPSLNPVANIPFYHEFAEKIAECQYYFKEFMKSIYGKKLNRYVLAIIVPDDTSRLESIFINEFFVNSGACKAVAQMPMSHALSKEERFISISKSKPELKIRKMQSCWGNCNRSKQIITMNEFLYKASPLCIEYIVLHELSHLIYPYHDKNFYNFIELHMPDWKERKKLLNSYYAV